MVFSSLYKRSLVTICISFLALSSAAHAGKVVYKWSDDKGVIHYTATPPLKRSHKHINKEGLTIGETSAPLTREQRDQQKANKVLEQQKLIEMDEQSKRGRLLLATYRSESDITSRLQSTLSGLGNELGLASKAYSSESERLRNQVKRAANLQRRGEALDQSTTDEILQQRIIVSGRQVRIEGLQTEMKNARTRFALDLARYRDLSNNTDSG